MKINIQNQNILITGATGGIGKEIVKVILFIVIVVIMK